MPTNNSSTVSLLTLATANGRLVIGSMSSVLQNPTDSKPTEFDTTLGPTAIM